MVSEEHKKWSERSWVVTLCDGLGVQGRALSVFHWFPHVLVMPNSPEPWERQMTKPIRTLRHDLAFPFRTKQGPGEGRGDCCFGNRLSLSAQCRADQPCCPFGYISYSWCVWEQKMCAVLLMSRRWGGFLGVPGKLGAKGTLEHRGEHCPQQPVLLAECCVENTCMSVFVRRRYMSLSLTVMSRGQ